MLAADRDRAAFAAPSADDFASLLAELRLEDPLRCEGGGGGCRRQPPAPPLFRRFSDLVAAGGSSISG